MKSDFILILQEVEMHPQSYLIKLAEYFERPSIIRVIKRDTLSKIKVKPVLNEQYLVLFESSKLLEHEHGSIKFDIMFPVIQCQTGSQVDEVKHFCQQKDLHYRIYYNVFSKEVAMQMIMDESSEEVTEAFIKSLLSRTGLNPKRILSALSICEQVGYTVANLNKYIDKYQYVDLREVLEVLLGLPFTKTKYRRVLLYLHQNRFWYERFSRANLVTELDDIRNIMVAVINGELGTRSIEEYIEDSGYSRFKVLYSLNLFEKVGITEVTKLLMYLKQATLLEVTLLLKGIDN